MENLTEAVYNHLSALHTPHPVRYMEHLGVVSALAALLARKRGMDVDVCQAAGLLHDLWMYKKDFPMTREEHRLHGETGSFLAREMLRENGGFSEDETEIVCRMISNHNYKEETHGEYDELLKDADLFAHLLKNSDYDKKYQYHGRGIKIIEEFGLTAD